MSKHTEGPWHVEARKGDTCICRVDGAILARLGASTNWRANARLIAAAPDLLKQLIVMAQHHVNGTRPTLEERNDAFYVIAKATGEAE